MPEGKLARILVPMDASEGAGRAAAFAVKLAEITGADVDVLHVTYFDKDTDAEEESWLPDSIAGSMGDEEQAALKMAEKYIPDGFAYEYHQRTGTPVEAILQFCEEGGHDCIVVGGRGLGVMEGLIFGSVSQELIERAKVSVVVVK
ncbi:MAG: universal stress protein [Selenomonas sp.]|nr:universal stress protein [Selenomonas sp.]